MNPIPSELRAVLERAQKAGMLGPDDVAAHVAHALEFLTPFSIGNALCVDLGSGAGVPGLPLALAYPETTWILLDAWEARCDQLIRAVRALDLVERVTVVHGRAEDMGRGTDKETADVVVARSFATPAVTAEYGGALVKPGGRLIISTQSGDARWPHEVPAIGLVTELAWTVEAGSFRSYLRHGDLDPRFPRRPAAQRRSPLF